MGARAQSAAIVGAAVLFLLVPTAAHAGPPAATPAGTGGGCKANGQVIAENAKTLQPFGFRIVRDNTPIAPLVGAFFAGNCRSAPN